MSTPGSGAVCVVKTGGIAVITRYLHAVVQDLPKALELYEYNVRLSEVLYGLLHGLEANSEERAPAA